MMKTYKLALITGGSSGIGLSIAKSLAKDGSDIGLLARDRVKLAAAQQEVEALAVQDGQNITTISCDVSINGSVVKVLRKWVRTNGVPDLVVNSAGVAYPGYFQDIDVETFHWLMNVNYFGTLHVLKYLVPLMIERGSGTIVNISSQAGFVGVYGYTGYGASKYAVRGLTDILRAEMKPYGIQVSIVFPPDTKTPQLEFEEPLKPIETKEIAGNAKALQPEQVAEAILQGTKNGTYVILPGFEGKIIYRLVNLLGNLTYPVMDWLVSVAQRKK